MTCILIFIVLIACTGTLVSAACPRLEMSPPRVVVKFGGSFSANCSSSSKQNNGFGWESPYGVVDLTMGVSSLSLKIDRVSAWEIYPLCYINLFDNEQCTGTLPVTVYKMPDSVFLRQSLTQLVEGQQYSIQCDIINVAPARSLSVLWHKGNEIFYSQTFDESRSSPVSKSSVLSLTARRDDDGAEIWCEAKLNLWPEEQGPPTMRSVSHKVTVLYPPTFTEPANETLEPSAGDEMTLNCTARGNPLPSYSWQFPWLKNQDKNQLILIRPFEHPGVYTCTASNSQGTATKYFTISEAPRDRMSIATLVRLLVVFGLLPFLAGLVFMICGGTSSCRKGDSLQGQPASSGPV